MKFFSCCTFEYGEQEEKLSPEQALMAGILESALVDARGSGWIVGDTFGGVAKRKKAALLWLSSDDVYCCCRRGISFRYVCEALEIEPHDIRTKAQLPQVL